MKNISGVEVQNLNNIYLSEGKIQENWRLFFEDMKNESNIEKILLFLKNKMVNSPQNIITLDIIDLMIDYGSPKTLNLIGQKEFIDLILNLLKPKVNAGIENQKKVIYLIKKWATKFSNNKNYIIFQENYNLLKTKGIIFPPENYRLSTYDKYITNKNQNINNNGKNMRNAQNNSLNKDNDFRLLKSQNNIKNNEIDNNNNIDKNNISNNNNYIENNLNNDNNNCFVNSNNNINNDNNDIDYSNYFGDNNNEQNENQIIYQKKDNNINGQSDFNQEKPFNRINDYYNSNPYNDENNELNNHLNSNNNNNISYENSNNEKIFYDSWIKKLNEYNGYIDEIYYLKNQNLKLKEGIKEILFTFPKIDIMINNCKEKRDNVGEKNLLNIKSDMEQTCDRYECFLRGKNIEPFISILKGNTRKYYFDKKYLTERVNAPPSNNNNNNNENSIINDLGKFGNSIKDGAFYLGRIIKNSTIKGYNYMKEKMNDDNSNNKNKNENDNNVNNSNQNYSLRNGNYENDGGFNNNFAKNNNNNNYNEYNNRNSYNNTNNNNNGGLFNLFSFSSNENNNNNSSNKINIDANEVITFFQNNIRFVGNNSSSNNY